MVDADQRAEQHAARGSHAGADGERSGVDPRHRDAHGLGHDAVLRGGTNPDAVLAVFEEQPKGADDGGRERRDQQPVPGVFKIEEGEITGEGLLDLARHRTELPNVARMVVRGSRPSSGRKVVICSAAPRSATTSVAMMSASQKLPEVASTTTPI